VAWSNFITGMDAGGHGIFDFVHRDPKTMLPYLSTSRTTPPEDFIELGKYHFPLDSGSVDLLRHGKPFWDVLEANGVETTIVRMPANFPPSGEATREISGMGTPDLLGTPGTFAFYTTDLLTYFGKEIDGGDVYEIFLEDGVAEATLYGPDNPFLREPEKLEVDFQIHVDPVEPLAKVVVGDEEVLLAVGEWSDWVPVTFDMIPTQHLPAITRFYLKSVEPELQLYAAPLNIDPLSPALPISTPDDYAEELAEATGRYYTQEMPEDTKALVAGVFTPQEFLDQAEITGQQFIDEYPYVLSQFERGFLFYYFGNADQVSHMMFRAMDPGHPAYDPEHDPQFADAVPERYVDFDGVVGYTLDHMEPDTLLIVMSDHGFTSWRRSFHLNTWLRENGYLTAIDPDRKVEPSLFANVDWSQTRAYGMGLNGLYINLEGREKNGIVAPSERPALMEEIAAKLLEAVDPVTGKQAITRVYIAEKYYEDRGYLDIGPDILVGYAKGVRGSNESALGELTAEIMSDNTSPWSGDHCMDHTAVPGILLTSRPLVRPAPSLKSLGASVLAEFGIEEGFPAREAGDVATPIEGDPNVRIDH
jgi:predicted AlkP superfamily phosphohydrolase/phosphomutase